MRAKTHAQVLLAAAALTAKQAVEAGGETAESFRALETALEKAGNDPAQPEERVGDLLAALLDSLL